ncbi:plasmanylethanolamine desaturase [Acrasis kona]|uniref:Plasmanylethanolamine desaturase n=1 Tax=Acrasis kona TaxID=1008807 RepID=A0AAW2YL99_9EUKA
MITTVSEITVDEAECLKKTEGPEKKENIHKFAKVKTERSKQLADGYSNEKRMMEITSISLFACFFFYNVYIIFPYINSTTAALMLLVAVVVGMLMADFVSGVIHWAADTWGTTEWAFVGNTFIRSFREHHIDPAAITRHDWIETNGDNALVSIFFLLPPHIINLLFYGSLPVPGMKLDNFQLFTLIFNVTFSLFIAFTNQFHKWAHSPIQPTIVRKMQEYGLILSRQNHLVHHKSPFDCYYCITTGWLNPFLTRIEFWRRFEELISYTTGLLPRSDDMKWNDHIDLLKDKKK